MREFVVTQILRRAVAALDLPPAEAPLRTSLVATQLVGLAMARYMLKVEPLATTPAEVLVAAVGPTVQRYLTGDLTGVFDPAAAPSTPVPAVGHVGAVDRLGRAPSSTTNDRKGPFLRR